MPGNSFGERFRVTTFGESHGEGWVVVIDGCPAGHPFPHERIAAQLARRRPGQSALTTATRRGGPFELLSGVDVDSGLTLGSPIAMLVRNKDHRSRTLRRARGDLPALARGLHLRRAVWAARGRRRRSILGARDRRPGRGGGPGRGPARALCTGSRLSPGSSRSPTLTLRGRPTRSTSIGRRSTRTRCAAPISARRGHRGRDPRGPQARRHARRRGPLRGP